MNNKRVFVRAKEGQKYRDEYTLRHIPDEGAWVTRTRHVDRRIAEKDLIVVDNPPTKDLPESKAEEPTKPKPASKDEPSRKSRQAGAESEG